jgi:hypothetical protein
VHGVNDVGQAVIHTAKPLVPPPRSFEVEIVTEKLRRCKLLDIDQAPAETIKAGDNTLHCEIHNKEELPQQWKESLFIRMMMKLTVVILEEYHCYQFCTKFYPVFFSHG